MASDDAAERFRVSGRVQGVGFRAATRREALRLGLHGHALNLADGSVEVLAEGPAAARDALADWLRRGPPLARVERLERIAVAAGSGPGFRVG